VEAAVEQARRRVEGRSVDDAAWEKELERRRGLEREGVGGLVRTVTR